MPSLRRILTISRKELLVLFGDRRARFMVIVPPIMQIVIFAWAATLEVRNVDVGVLNQDNGRWSREIVQSLEGSPLFRSVTPIHSQQELTNAINTQKVLLVLSFDSQFSRSIDKGENESAQCMLILDGRRSNAAQITARYMEEIVFAVAQRTPAYQQALSQDRIASPDIVLRYWFNPNLEFQWFFLPNLIATLSFVMGLVVTGLSVAREREIGTFDQLLVSPASLLEIAVAKLIPGALIGMAHGTIFLFFACVLFSVPFTGSMTILYVGLLLFCLAVGGLGLMISAICSTQQQAFLGAFTCIIPCILLSGFVSPIANMPLAFQYASLLNPVRHFIVIVQGVFLKDITLTSALHSCTAIAILALAFVSVAIVMFRRRA